MRNLRSILLTIKSHWKGLLGGEVVEHDQLQGSKMKGICNRGGRFVD